MGWAKESVNRSILHMKLHTYNESHGVKGPGCIHRPYPQRPGDNGGWAEGGPAWVWVRGQDADPSGRSSRSSRCTGRRWRPNAQLLSLCSQYAEQKQPRAVLGTSAGSFKYGANKCAACFKEHLCIHGHPSPKSPSQTGSHLLLGGEELHPPPFTMKTHRV